jgi:hypothetical protein
MAASNQTRPAARRRSQPRHFAASDNSKKCQAVAVGAPSAALPRLSARGGVLVSWNRKTAPVLNAGSGFYQKSQWDYMMARRSQCDWLLKVTL